MSLSITTAAIPRATLPNGKTAPVDLLALIGQYGTARFREGYQSASDRYRQEYGDSASLDEITEEVERLHGCEEERNGLMEASTGVLLVLSLLERQLGSGARQVVEAFRAALQECKS